MVSANGSWQVMEGLLSCGDNDPAYSKSQGQQMILVKQAKLIL
jgi:hypothetical protein